LKIREYTSDDLDALRAIHARQGFDYALPDLSDPRFISKIVLSDEEAGEERIVGAALLRLTSEAYLLLDPKFSTPRERWVALLALHAATEWDAWRRGLEDVHAWLPPGLERKFGKRLERLGWVRDDKWTPYCKRVGGFGNTET
jgi:hypothetical protein